MGGVGFIIAINVAVAGLLAAAFLLISAYDRAYRSARWLSAAYALGVVYCLFELAIPLVPGSRLIVSISYASLLAGIVAYVVGIARKYSAQVPWPFVAVLFVVAVSANLYVQAMPRELILRNILWQSPYAAMHAIAAVIVLRAAHKTALDKVLCGVLWLSVAQFMAKPWIMASVGGNGASAENYIQTTYALFSQTIGSLVSFAVAMVTLAVYVRSMLADAAVRSETDELSGLLNRRGFEDHADVAMADMKRLGMPFSLVICDIDLFKSVNDTYGHDAGDRVIQAFAAVMRDSAGGRHAVGRIGGEEFAIAMPGADQSTARLVAEGARIAFSQAAVPGLAGLRTTASFGVAEGASHETYREILRRADLALYEAKNSGRDCVRVALPALRYEAVDRPPERRSVRAVKR